MSEMVENRSAVGTTEAPSGVSRWRKIFGRSAAVTQGPFQTHEELETWMTVWLAQKMGCEANAIDRTRPLSDYGLDSMVAVELSGQLEQRLGRPISPSIAWELPTVAELATHLMEGGSGEALDMDAV
jgi:acyl carrier protein